MEQQRTLRLGDIVDDYCPRERRITNHAIVAIVEDAVRQTRCTTCDAEHAYKGGREPKRRKNGPLGPEEQALVEAATQLVQAKSPAAETALTRPEMPAGSASVPAPESTPVSAVAAKGADPPDSDVPPDDGWTAHRTLIRATLPRTEGEPPQPRPIPEFTMHQRPSQGRRGGFRPDSYWNGNGHSANGNRGDRQPQPGNQAQPQGQGHPRRRRGRHKRAR